MRIDMDNDREALGLPTASPLPDFFRTAATGFLVVFLAALAGYGAAHLRNFYETYSLQQLMEKYDLATTPEQQAELALTIKQQSPNTALGRYIAGRHLESAATTQPYAKNWESSALYEYQSALQLPNDGEDADKFEFELKMRCAGLLLEAGKGKEALELVEPLSLENASADSPIVEAYRNLVAYILASSNNPDVRDGKRALQMIKNVIRRQGYALEPAYMDTLAESYYASGDPTSAVKIQKWALALASEPLNWIYIEHYDKYLAAEKVKYSTESAKKAEQTPPPASAMDK